MKRFIKEYANYKINSHKNNELMLDTIRNQKISTINKSLILVEKGMITIDEAIKTINEN